MRFICDGQEFDTGEMICPQIKDKYILTAYITSDYGQVFSSQMVPVCGVVVNRMEGIALRMLAERTGNTDLAKAVEVEVQKKGFI